MKLLLNAIIKFIVGITLVGALVFLPAGTFNYLYGWVFMTALFVPMFMFGIILFVKFPKLLKKRLYGKEKENTQKGVIAFSALIFLSGFITAGLDFRFGWSSIPNSVKIIAVVLFLASYGLYAEVMRENEYLSRTIEVQENQKVIDTGLYGIVRHPMYSATILMFIMIPLILDSWFAFAILLAYPVIIAIRISNEEKVLTEHLEGYKEYKQKVRYKILPFIW